MSPKRPKNRKVVNHSDTATPTRSVRDIWNRVAAFVGRHLVDNIIAAAVGGLIVYAYQEWRHPSPLSTAPIAALIQQEADLALGPHSDDAMNKYANLFAPDAWVIDFGKPEEPWKGSAVVDRIRTLHFSKLEHTPRQIVVSEDGSVAFAETKTIFELDQPTRMIRQDTEYWQFGKLNGSWKIRSFEFGHPP